MMLLGSRLALSYLLQQWSAKQRRSDPVPCHESVGPVSVKLKISPVACRQAASMQCVGMSYGFLYSLGKMTLIATSVACLPIKRWVPEIQIRSLVK